MTYQPPTHLLQDECQGLSRWLATRLNAIRKQNGKIDMKAIDFAVGLKKKLANNLAPISKGEINLLIDMLEKEQAEKPTVVVKVKNGSLIGVTTSCEVRTISVDYDFADKLIATGEVAAVDFIVANCCPIKIAEWVALANQE